uniref:Uncharacterized protein n=1 Tax=Romanomermis culicivorax TaxID=13658 RepID=A0A915ILD3_ROMCU
MGRRNNDFCLFAVRATDYRTAAVVLVGSGHTGDPWKGMRCRFVARHYPKATLLIMAVIVSTPVGTTAKWPCTFFATMFIFMGTGTAIEEII